MNFNLCIPSHINPLGSGSHSPFPIHIDELGPVSTCPGGQLNLTVLSSIVKPWSSNRFGTGLEYPQVDNKSGFPQLAKNRKKNKQKKQKNKHNQ